MFSKIILLTLLVLLYLFRLSQIPQYEIPEGKLVKIRGMVSQQPYLKDTYQIIYIGPIMIKTARFPGYFYGDRLEIVGKFTKRVINPFQLNYFASFPTIRMIEEGENRPGTVRLTRVILQTRGLITQKLSGFLPEPHSSLLLGILFGVKKEMPEKFLQDLRKTGTLHLVVASGQNVSLLSGLLMGILLWLIPRRQALFLASTGVILYVIMVGSEAPAVRAGIMAIFAFLGQAIGREGRPLVFLLFSAIIILLISPLMLFDVGFQLSFAAMLGIILIYPRLKKKRLLAIPVLGDSLSVTISAQAMTFPILLLNFGQFSLFSPLINTLVIPTVLFIMVLGAITAVISLVITPLAQLLAWITWPFLAWFVKIIELAGGISWISFEIGKLPTLPILGYYFILAMALFRFKQKRSGR